MPPRFTGRRQVRGVNPKPARLSKKGKVPPPAPKPAVELTPGTATYKARLEAGGQTMPMDLTRTVKDLNGSWVVTETSVMPMGTIQDEAPIDKGTLQLRKR